MPNWRHPGTAPLEHGECCTLQRVLSGCVCDACMTRADGLGTGLSHPFFAILAPLRWSIILFFNRLVSRGRSAGPTALRRLAPLSRFAAEQPPGRSAGPAIPPGRHACTPLLIPPSSGTKIAESTLDKTGLCGYRILPPMPVCFTAAGNGGCCFSAGPRRFVRTFRGVCRPFAGVEARLSTALGGEPEPLCLEAGSSITL